MLFTLRFHEDIKYELGAMMNLSTLHLPSSSLIEMDPECLHSAHILYHSRNELQEMVRVPETLSVAALIEIISFVAAASCSTLLVQCLTALHNQSCCFLKSLLTHFSSRIYNSWLWLRINHLELQQHKSRNPCVLEKIEI